MKRRKTAMNGSEQSGKVQQMNGKIELEKTAVNTTFVWLILTLWLQQLHIW